MTDNASEETVYVDSNSGAPRPIKRRKAQAPTNMAGHSTVVYFTPDGEVTRRYELPQASDTRLMAEAFLVLRVIPETSTTEPGIEILKYQGDLSALMTNAAKAFINTPPQGPHPDQLRHEGASENFLGHFEG